MQIVLHDDYQRILGPYPYNVPLGFRWFLNNWKFEQIESTPTNVSFEKLFLNKVKPIQEKQKKNVKYCGFLLAFHKYPQKLNLSTEFHIK